MPVRGIEHVPWLYDALMALPDRGRLGRWRERLVAEARGRTLEVGCGTGRNLPRYPESCRPIGLDPDLAVLLRARGRAPAVPLLVAEVEALPFADGSLDTVVSSLVFCSVTNPAAGLDELRRALTPSGRLAMMEHVRSRYRLVARLQDLFQPLWTWITGGCHPNRRTETSVERNGFRIEPEGYRRRGTMRLFRAVPQQESGPGTSGEGAN